MRFAVAILALTAIVLAEPPPATTLPVAWENLAIYSRSFDADGEHPRVEDGALLGRSLRLVGGRPWMATDERFSPHRPRTYMFWWAFTEDLPIDGSTHWFTLEGKGRRRITFFTKGKGQWCALTEPAGVLQIWDFPQFKGISLRQNGFARTLELTAGTWHHTAIVVTAAGAIQVFLDGELWRQARPNLPGIQVEDQVHKLILGGLYGGNAEILADELIVLGRALNGDAINEYVAGVRAWRQAVQ